MRKKTMSFDVSAIGVWTDIWAAYTGISNALN